MPRFPGMSPKYVRTLELGYFKWPRRCKLAWNCANISVSRLPINIYATEVPFFFFFCLEFDFELLLRVQPSWFTAPMSDTNPGAAILVHSLSMKSREGLTFSRTLKSQCVRYKTAAPTAKPLTFKCWFVTNPTTLNGLKNCCECICPVPPPPPPFKRTFDVHSFGCCLEHRVQCSLF